MADPCLPPSGQGIPGSELCKGNVLAGQSDSRKWHNPVSHGGFWAQNTGLSLGFFSHNYHNLVLVICCSLVKFDLSVILEREILQQIRESPFLSDLKHMFL